MRRSVLITSTIFLATAMSFALLIPAGVSGAQQSTTEGTTSEGTTSPSEAVPEETVLEGTTSEDTVSEEPGAEDPTPKEADPVEEAPEPPGAMKPSSGEEAARQLRSGASPYRAEPPDLYPGRESIPEAGEDFPAYNQVVDNAKKGSFTAPGWSTEPSKPGSYGEDYRVADESGDAKVSRYKVKIPATDVYSVYAWWPRKMKGAKARFGVSTDSGVEWSKVDQGIDGGYWVPIGEYRMEKGTSRSIRIAPVSGGPTVADAVAVVRGVVDFPPEPPARGNKDSNSKQDSENATSSSSDETTYSGASGARKISRRAIIRRAQRHIGTPYRLGGLNVCVSKKWEDCSCFTRLVFKKWRTLADNPARQLRARKMVKIRRSNLRGGDLVFHDTTRDGRMGAYDHVSIYAGNGYVIHANSYYLYKKVHKQKMKWLAGYWGARRVRY